MPSEIPTKPNRLASVWNFRNAEDKPLTLIRTEGLGAGSTVTCGLVSKLNQFRQILEIGSTAGCLFRLDNVIKSSDEYGERKWLPQNHRRLHSQRDIGLAL